MFAPTRYLEWARRFYGKVRFDLATSGMPTMALNDIARLDGASFDDPLGWSRLRQAVATHNDVPHEEVVATVGATQALWLACVSLAGPNDDVLVEEPAYEPLVRIAEGVGARVIRFGRAVNERFALDPERIARAITPRTRLVVVTNLHNPGGVRADDGALRGAARVAEANGAYLLVDEVYAAFDELVDSSGVFRKSSRKLAGNIVAASSLTKCYGLGPHRIGWLLGPREVIARAEDAVTATCGVLPVSHAGIAVAAFDNLTALAAVARSRLAGKRDQVAAWVAEQGFSWSAPEDGLFGFVIVPGRGDLTAVIEAAAREREVLVAAGAFFGIPNGFRVAWSAPRATLDEGLARLAAALRATPG